MPTDNMNLLMDQIRVNVPGVLDAAIYMEFSSAMKDFFEGSNIWTDDIEFDVSPDDADLEYEVVTGEGGDITRLMCVRNAENVLVPATMPTPGYILLSSAAGQAQTYTATVALTLRATNTEPDFPDWVLGKYFNYILDGVVGRLQSQTAKPYYNPQLAMLRRRSFQQGVRIAKKNARHQNAYSAQRWNFPRGTR